MRPVRWSGQGLNRFLPDMALPSHPSRLSHLCRTQVITEKAPHRVVSLVEGGAAQACGEIQMGDILLSIDDANIERLPMTYIKPMLLGETGSKVRLQKRPV